MVDSSAATKPLIGNLDFGSILQAKKAILASGIIHVEIGPTQLCCQ
jgi:hypothetical protein